MVYDDKKVVVDPFLLGIMDCLRKGLHSLR